MNLSRLALRNLGRRRARTALTAGMLLVCTGLVVFTNGLSDGTYLYMIRATTDAFGGQAQLLAPGYHDSPSMHATVDDPAGWMARARAHPEVLAATARVEGAGLLSAGARSAGVALQGLDPVSEPGVSTLHRAVVQGAWLPEGEREDGAPLLLGRGVARRLEVGLGDEVVFLGQAADGSIAAELFRVHGVVETGVDELDAVTAFARLDDARALLELEGRAHRVVLRLADPARAPALAAALELAPAGSSTWERGAAPEWWPWQALSPAMVDSMEADRAGDRLFRGILMLVALLGLANTMMMSVFERRRELGILGALGTSPAQLLGLTTAEGAWLTTLGVGLGALLGMALNAWFADRGIVITDEPMEFGGMVFDRMFTANTWTGSVLFPGLLWVGGLLAGLWPAYHAARLDPVLAMRQG